MKRKTEPTEEELQQIEFQEHDYDLRLQALEELAELSQEMGCYDFDLKYE